MTGLMDVILSRDRIEYIFTFLILDLTEAWNLFLEDILSRPCTPLRGSSAGAGGRCLGDEVTEEADMDLGKSAKDNFLTLEAVDSFKAGVDWDFLEECLDVRAEFFLLFLLAPGIAGRSIRGEEGETAFIPS